MRIQVRQLNSMGVEGIYAEDDAADYAPSLIQPSIVPPGSVIYGGPPSYRSKPASPGCVLFSPLNENHDFLCSKNLFP